MIRLIKGTEPAVLVTNGAAWTAEYKRALAGEDVPKAALTRYRHPDIKEALRLETFDKCAYCESKMTHVSPGDIEHIIPKSFDADLVCAWLNLTLACTECNRRKLDHHDPALPFLHPYDDEPSDHLMFEGPWITHKAGADRGWATRQRLELNRPELVQRRVELLERIQMMVDALAAEDDVAKQAIILVEIHRTVGPEGEYSAIARAFLDDRGLAP